jgi:Outer membrane efflux protein
MTSASNGVQRGTRISHCAVSFALCALFSNVAFAQPESSQSSEISPNRPIVNLVAFRAQPIGMVAAETLDLRTNPPIPHSTSLHYSPDSSNTAENPTDAESSPATFSPEYIAQLAASQSTAAKLLRSQMQSSRTKSRHKSDGDGVELYNCFVQLQADRQAQISAEKALEAYYGLAALTTAAQIQRELITEIDELKSALLSIVDNGIAVGDLTLLDRARIQAMDALVQSESGSSKIHSQLSLLIGSDYACSLQINGLEQPSLQATDVCALIQQAHCSRRDLAAWVLLGERLSADNLELARGAIGSVTSIPLFPLTSKCGLIEKLTGIANARTQDELHDRQKQIREFQQSLKNQITVEVEVAWVDSTTALTRWEYANQSISSWRERLDQLDRAAELGRVFPQDRITAKLELKKAQLELVQRWNDFQQAKAKLRLAVGDLPTH